ncbi:hypothetical protein QEN19_003086 [Hanseniaspora menglaensis]
MYKGDGSNFYQGLVKTCYDIPEHIDSDTFRIMITTDNHIGYKENDSYIERDSYKNFQEVLEICNNLGNVDFMINSGDLFHDNYFSSKNLNFITDLLVNTCLNDNPISFKTEHKPEHLTLNYESENVNVGLPIFIINGNHDFGNSIGTENVSILKILSNLKLINYLGNYNIKDKEDVEIEPVILTKGSTQLNLYGLSNIKEERLNKLIRSNRLTFLTNDELTPKGLNLLLLHQNRSSNINKNYLNENLLPDFLDLLVWGHEHECIPDLAYNSLKNFNILQPGSTVQTSFHESELKTKSAFLLDFKDNTYTIYPIPLKSVRPMKVRSLSLKESNVPKDLEQITKIVVDTVEEMLHDVEKDIIKQELNLERRINAGKFDKANFLIKPSELTFFGELSKSSKKKLLPLIRLKIDYTGYEDISFRSINNRFMGKVANPATVLKLSKTYARKQKNVNDQSKFNAIDQKFEGNLKNSKLSTNDQLVAIIRDTFKNDQKLIALDENSLLEFFSKNLSNSISESKVNLEKFITTETERATQALVEKTKDEINKLALRTITESQSQIKDQPLLTNTKDYRKLLKDVSNLLNKQIKSPSSIPSKRNRSDDGNEESLKISSKDKYHENNDVIDIVMSTDEKEESNQDFMALTDENIKPKDFYEAKEIDLTERVIKRPKSTKKIIDSDSDSDFLFSSDQEISINKLPSKLYQNNKVEDYRKDETYKNRNILPNSKLVVKNHSTFSEEPQSQIIISDSDEANLLSSNGDLDSLLGGSQSDN